jgi:uncharacterized protein (UPF0335 family)
MTPQAMTATAVSSPADGENFSAGQLKAFIKRIEKLEEDKAAVLTDIKEIYAEAKGTGFDPKIMRQVIRLRKMEDQARVEQAELLDLYQSVLGMEA